MAWNYNQVILPSDCDSWDNKAEKTLATSTVSGLLSFSDKAKLNSIESGAQKNPEFASKAQAEEGTNTTRVMNPLRVKEAISALTPTPTIATQSESETGTNNTKYMSPLRAKQAIDFNNKVRIVGFLPVETLSSQYPEGFSYMSTSTGQTGYPAGEFGSVVTYKRSASDNTRCIQYNFDNSMTGMYMRAVSSTTGEWTDWRRSIMDNQMSSDIQSYSDGNFLTSKATKDWVSSVSPIETTYLIDLGIVSSDVMDFIQSKAPFVSNRTHRFIPRGMDLSSLPAILNSTTLVTTGDASIFLSMGYVIEIRISMPSVAADRFIEFHTSNGQRFRFAIGFPNGVITLNDNVGFGNNQSSLGVEGSMVYLQGISNVDNIHLSSFGMKNNSNNNRGTLGRYMESSGVVYEVFYSGSTTIQVRVTPSTQVRQVRTRSLASGTWTAWQDV